MFYTMQGLMKRQTYVPNTPRHSSLAIHKTSQIVSKPKPKIRVIHIVEPEIIKTDVANFRELVQTLTGKPAPDKNVKMKPRKGRRGLSKRIGFGSSLEFRGRVVKGEEYESEIWDGSGLGGGFLGGFENLDGYMQELNEFPLLPIIDV